MQGALTFDRRAQNIFLGVMLLCIALSAYTGEYLLTALPFGFLYVLLMGVNWRIAYFIMLFTIPISYDLSFLGNSISTSVPDEPMMWLFTLLFVVLLAKNPNMIPGWWWRNPLVMVMVLQFLWLLVTVYFSHEQMLSIKYLLAKSWFLIAFFILPIFVFQQKRDFKAAFLLFMVPLVGTMIVITFRHAMLGFHFRKVEKAIGDIYVNHVDYSTLMSMLFPVLWIAYALAKKKSHIFRIAVLVLIIAFVPIIYLTYARAALLAIVFAACIGIAIRLRLVNLIMPAFYIICTVVVIYMVKNNRYLDFRPNFEKTYMHDDFAHHMIATFRGEDMSSMERLYRWIAAVRMSQDEPILGYGPNAFYYYYKPYAVHIFKTYVSRNPEQSTTHNYFLYMLVEQGWPGMILYAIMMVVIFAHAQKVYHRLKDRFYRNCTLAVAMLIGAGFINNFFSELLENHKVGSLFYLGMALLVVLDRKSRVQQEESADPVVVKP